MGRVSCTKLERGIHRGNTPYQSQTVPCYTNITLSLHRKDNEHLTNNVDAKNSY